MKISKSQRNNIIFLVLIALLLIPQTRKPIQVFLNKGLALFSPSIVDQDKRKAISDFNWNLQNTNTLETYNFKNTEGKVVLVNFWATWCPPCIAELPSLDQLYQSYNDKVVFLFVSNEEISVVNKFLIMKGMSLPVFKPISNYPEVFDVSSIPRTFLIDKKGNIVIDKTGAANWNSKKVREQLDRLLE
jgi:thiol-disulfide isomerase/thioredoxin